MNTYTLEHKDQKEGIHYYRLSEISTAGDINPLSLKAINLQASSDVTIFPNPATEGNPITVLYKAKKEIKNSYIEFYSLIGTIVKRISLNSDHSIYKVDLPRGHYITRLIEDSESITVGKLTVL